MKYKSTGTGYVLVIVNETHKKMIGKGVDGKDIVLNEEYSPLKHANNMGEVIQVPSRLGAMPIYQEPSGYPSYGPKNLPDEDVGTLSPALYAIGGVYKYKLMKDIPQVVHKGDTIIFSPRALNNPDNRLGGFKSESGEISYVYKVPYDMIFAKKHNTGYYMVGGNVFVEPIWEDENMIYKPTYYPYLDQSGNKIERPKSEWLQIKLVPEHDSMKGIVRYVNEPLKGDKCHVKKGDTVIFRPIAGWMNVIEGRKYLVMKQHHILAKVK
jgi:hypothetical protein